jgi:hypothetical protein
LIKGPGFNELVLLGSSDERHGSSDDPRRIAAFSPGKKLCKVNPMGISGMKQGLRDRMATDVKRVTKPWKCPWWMRHYPPVWKLSGIKVP